MNNICKKNKIRTKKFFGVKCISGFTLIEMISVMAIFGIVTSAVLFNLKPFNSSVKLQGLAQDVALVIKKAQTDSLAGVLPSGNINVPLNWTPSYGIRFKADESGLDDDSKKIIRFFDLNSSAVDNPADTLLGDLTWSGNTETVDSIDIVGGEYISKICINQASEGDLTSCFNSENGFVDLVFVRPDTAPSFAIDGVVDGSISDIVLNLTSSESVTRFVTVYSTGQISVR